MKKTLLLVAHLASSVVFFFANSDVKAEILEKAEAKSGVVKWFHFNGSNSIPSDLTDPTKNSAETSPVCPTDTPEAPTTIS